MSPSLPSDVFNSPRCDGRSFLAEKTGVRPKLKTLKTKTAARPLETPLLLNRTYVNWAAFQCATLKGHFVMLIEEMLQASSPESFLTRSREK